MSGNSIGKMFRLSTFGESHGPAIGGVIDGCPPGISVDHDLLKHELSRRQTARAFWSSPRKEPDDVEFIAGVYEGKTTGTSLAFIIKNKDARPADYTDLKDLYRPSHADYTYEQRYGRRDFRGGGRASARETIARVVAGTLAKAYLREKGVSICGMVSSIGEVKLPRPWDKYSAEEIDGSDLYCPNPEITEKMLEFLRSVKLKGDSAGGTIACFIKGVPAGLGEPVFDKLNADLAKAVMGINAAKGIEFGSGFRAASMKGSEHNDIFSRENGKIITKTNHSGGIQGGISNGMDIYFNAAFKPPSTVALEQKTINKSGEEVVYRPKGRHDLCYVPRCVPVVEAMAAVVVADHLLRLQAYQ